MRAYFQMFAGYNAWANHRLHAACALLDEADYKAQREITARRVIAVAHMFNHQTHHRGQVHGLLSQAGIDPPSLDLPVFQKASGLGFIDREC